MLRLLTLVLMFCSLIISSGSFAADDEEEQPEEKQKAVYYSLSPSLIANVQGKAKYARCDVQFMAKGEESIAEIQLHSPALRHELLLLLSDQQGKELKTPKGKESFRKAALKAVQKVIKDMTDKELIEDLFFTSFFVQ